MVLKKSTSLLYSCKFHYHQTFADILTDEYGWMNEIFYIIASFVIRGSQRSVKYYWSDNSQFTNISVFNSISLLTFLCMVRKEL